jgi:hypothetical protein
MNAITSENQNIFHDDGGYLKVIRHAPSRKIITLSSSNDKLFIIDADSSSSTFHTVIKTIDCEQTLGLTINNAEDTAYAVGMQEISVIDLATGTIKTKIGLSGYAQDDLELDEEHNRAYVIVYSQSSNPVNHLAVIDIDPNSSTFNTELKLIPIVHDRCSCLYFDYPYAYADSSHSADYADNRFLFRINVLTEETKKIQLLDNQVDSIINTSKEVIYYIDIDDKLLNNFRINTFSLPKNETIQTEYLPSGAKYYVLNIAEDSS